MNAMQPIDSLRAQLQGGDEEELFDALTDIGKKRIRALEADVVPFLQHPSGELRGAAARTLGFHLRAQAHRDAIRRMAVQAGLDLPEALMNELCTSYPAFEAMVRRLPRARLKSDEPAHHCVAAARIAKLDR